ncbi:hypothetical protein LTR85_011943 [Meristemomyces frigidus]|nr:hypothetical protein LTR85_011943 [Meristemomyces frigidus]
MSEAAERHLEENSESSNVSERPPTPDSGADAAAPAKVEATSNDSSASSAVQEPGHEPGSQRSQSGDLESPPNVPAKSGSVDSTSASAAPADEHATLKSEQPVTCSGCSKSLSSEAGKDESASLRALEERLRKLEHLLESKADSGHILRLSGAPTSILRRLITVDTSDTDIKLTIQPDNDPAPEEKETEQEWKTSISAINYVSRDEHKPVKLSPEKERHAIDVCMALQLDTSCERASVSGQGTGDSAIHWKPKDEVLRKQEPVRFIQINSVDLISVLTSEPEFGMEIAKEKAPLMIFSPFKSLIVWDSKLRDLEKKLAKEHEIVSVPTPEPPDQSVAKSEDTGQQEQSDPRPSAPSASASAAADGGSAGAATSDMLSRKGYKDLRLLLTFSDHFVMARYRWFRGKEVTDVRFGDLCYLFQPGDEVLDSEPPLRAWKIVKITGGRPTMPHLLKGDVNRVNDNDPGIAPNTVSDKAAGEAAAATLKGLPAPKKAKEDESTKWTPFYLDGYYIDFDGNEFGVVHKSATINFFSGRREVKALKVYPLRLCEDPKGTREKLMARGSRFFEMHKDQRPTIHYYDDLTLTEKTDGEPLPRYHYQGRSDDEYQDVVERPERAVQVSSQVVIDPKKTFQYRIDWQPVFGIGQYTASSDDEVDPASMEDAGYGTERFQNFEWFDDRQARNFASEDDLLKKSHFPMGEDRLDLVAENALLLPDRAFGFVLRSRDWACFNIEKLRPEFESDAEWKDLQIPKTHRDQLESMMESHFRTKQAHLKQELGRLAFDSIEGKGRGLVILLHGAPGLGKTSTAESIARLYKKPLLPITCGNLGLTPKSVEDALTENFGLAVAWDSIVLIDEADVFLARRNVSDLKRNALVSIFLRTLEYYSGILFLTTNRPGDFDEAFRSRIQIALEYQDLDEEDSVAIWTTNLHRIQTKKAEIGQQFNIERDDILRFARRVFRLYSRERRPVWNGRQIRNSFSTAVAFAEFEAKGGVPTLTYEHFKQAAINADRFEMYLKRTKNLFDWEVAGEDGFRSRFVPDGKTSLAPEQKFHELLKKLDPIEDAPISSQREAAAGVKRTLTLNDKLEQGDGGPLHETGPSGANQQPFSPTSPLAPGSPPLPADSQQPGYPPQPRDYGPPIGVPAPSYASQSSHQHQSPYYPPMPPNMQYMQPPESYQGYAQHAAQGYYLPPQPYRSHLAQPAVSFAGGQNHPGVSEHSAYPPTTFRQPYYPGQRRAESPADASAGAQQAQQHQRPFGRG